MCRFLGFLDISWVYKKATKLAILTTTYKGEKMSGVKLKELLTKECVLEK